MQIYSTCQSCLETNKSDVKGKVAINNISLAGDGCEQVGLTGYESDLSATVFGSGFSGTLDSLNVSGQFTSDLIRGKYGGNIDTYAFNGDFTASRTN